MGTIEYRCGLTGKIITIATVTIIVKTRVRVIRMIKINVTIA